MHDYALAANPDEPDGPWRLQYIGAALFFSLLLGAGFAVTRELFNHTLRSSVDVEVELDLPAIGLIRLVPSRQLEDFGPTAESAAWRELAEDYRRLRTSMLLPMNGQAAKSWLVTSSRPHEGKTTTAINLATSLVQTGTKVLLIDADFRRPQLHSAFGLTNERGLTTLLTSAAPPPSHWEPGSGSETAAADCIQLHPSSGIYVLPAGPHSSSVAELLGSDRMTTLLESLRRHFNHIVIDTPPITSYIDSVVLSVKVDGVLLVVKASTTPLESARYAKQLLDRAGATVWGVVLNHVEPVDAEVLRLRRLGRVGRHAASSSRTAQRWLGRLTTARATGSASRCRY